MEIIEGCSCVCGEAPIWVRSENKIYWVDTENPFCYRMDIDTRVVEKIGFAGNIQAMGMRKGGGWIAQSPTNLLLLDSELQLEKDLGRLLPEDSKCVLNDSIVGPDGRYYIGFYDPVVCENKIGGLIRIDHDYTAEIILEGYAVPNGMAFSLDSAEFYFTEMFDSRILKFDFDSDTGSLSNQRIFTTVVEDGIYPDGLIIDKDGYLWSGHWQGFRIVRYNPEGGIDTVLPAPMPTPTCLAALADNRIFVTTASKGCSEEQLKEYTLSGRCYLHDIEVKPVEEYLFTGV